MTRRQQNYWLPFTIYHIDQRNFFTIIIKIEQKIDNYNLKKKKKKKTEVM